MIYDFETAAYNLKLADFYTSTQVGYHIVKLNDKRPALYRFKVAHILLYPPDADELQKN